jgi:galactokinase
MELLARRSVAGMDERLERSALNICRLFHERYVSSLDPAVTLGFVPGRVEVAGKHTDYAGGHTLVCAIEKGFLFVAGANSSGLIRIIEDSLEFDPIEFPFTEGIEPPLGRWANYPMTTAQRVAGNFSMEEALAGVDIAFTSDVPVGSGMSGSSALMMMCFCAIAVVNRIHSRKTFKENIRSDIDLAMYLACAENGQSFRNLPGGRGVGTFGGSEDHTAILNCRDGSLSLYQYAPTAFKAEAAWPTEWMFVLAFCGVRAEKTKEALRKYNLASKRAAEAVQMYNRIYGKKLNSLAEIDAQTRGAAIGSWLKGLEGHAPEEKALDLPGRVRQFLLEERKTTPRALEAMLWRDLDAFGAAVNASHRASRRLLWNIAPEIDFLQRSALNLGAAGASGFGAGFGGSIFAVIQTEDAAQFASAWRKEYVRRYPEREKESAFFLTRPSSGIRIWDENGPARFVDTLF